MRNKWKMEAKAWIDRIFSSLAFNLLLCQGNLCGNPQRATCHKKETRSPATQQFAEWLQWTTSSATDPCLECVRCWIIQESIILNADEHNVWVTTHILRDNQQQTHSDQTRGNNKKATSLTLTKTRGQPKHTQTSLRAKDGANQNKKTTTAMLSRGASHLVCWPSQGRPSPPTARAPLVSSEESWR